MNLIRVEDNEEFVVDYDSLRNMYRLTILENGVSREFRFTGVQIDASPVQHDVPTPVRLSSKYALILRDILEPFRDSDEPVYYFIDMLKARMGATNYSRWPDFRRDVLNRAIEEINNKTDLLIEYVAHKPPGSRSIGYVEFHVSTNGAPASYVSYRKGAPDRDELLDVARKYEFRLADIAMHYDVTERVVRLWLKDLGLPHRSHDLRNFVSNLHC